MRTRMSIVAGLVLSMFASGVLAAGAAATPPVTMSSGFITDEAGILTSAEISATNERLTALSDGGRGELFFVFVDEFTEPSSSDGWADQTAIDNGLDVDQYLIAVAVEAGQYGISVDQEASLSDGEIDAVLQAMRPELRDGDWEGAMVAAADAFPGQGGAAEGGGAVWIIVLLVVAVAAVIIIVLIVRSRKKARQQTNASVPDPNDPYASVSDEDLETQAGSALVQADDAITASRQELGFAVAQYGDESAEDFTRVVEAAKAKVGEAFALKQKLDDEIPDSAEQRRTWYIQIIQLCDEADDLLNDNIEAFEELRKLESEAPQALERIKARRATAEQTVATVAPALATLTQTYDATALAPVADNPDQARQRLALADSEIAEAATAIAEGNNGEAAFAIRTAEESVEQSEALVDAVTALGTNLATVEDQARATIADLEADIAAAGAMSDADGRLAPVIARTRTKIDAATTNLQAASRNPQQILDTLTQANTDIDAALGQVRQATEQAQRTQRVLDQRLAQARAQIVTANDFITTRRGAIGATARTRLAEANAAYNEALAAQTSDPVLATERATRAYNLASEAVSYARSEVDSFTTGGWGGGGGWGGSHRSGDSDFGDAFLGGLLGGLFSGGGGGGGGGGWSSGGGGGSWRSGSSSRGSRSRPSSFGGGSRRSSSRSGGRSRGGRF